MAQGALWVLRSPGSVVSGSTLAAMMRCFTGNLDVGVTALAGEAVSLD
jgi:hypothetical protein